MKLYLAGVAPWRESGLYTDAIKKYSPFILESFYYADAYTERLLPYYGDFLLDSGAFTFMQNEKSHVNWGDYIEKYAGFIVKNNVSKYFELDIDSVVGYANVLQIRKRLESLTGRQCIPVWHPSRGTKEFEKMCEEYPYVALGGIAGSKKGSEEYRVYQAHFPQFIKTAHRYNSKIHGLGYTSLEGIKVNHFDSVDSTAWTTGNRFGYVYHFNGKTMEKRDVPQGKRFSKSKVRDVALCNFLEWIKFQKYALTHL